MSESCSHFQRQIQDFDNGALVQMIRDILEELEDRTSFQGIKNSSA